MQTHDLTRLLKAWSAGRGDVEEALWSVVYDEVKKVAHNVRRGHRRGGRGPRTTTLVHEAFVRLTDGDVSPRDRRHFYALAARAMRFVLADEARRRLAQKRGGNQEPGELPPQVAAGDAPDADAEEILAVHQALDRLRQQDSRLVDVVELRYFAGLSVRETADVLQVSTPTVKRDWQTARTWLYGELRDTTPG